MPNTQDSKNKSSRGLSAMDKKQQRELASKGGKSKSASSTSTAKKPTH